MKLSRKKRKAIKAWGRGALERMRIHEATRKAIARHDGAAFARALAPLFPPGVTIGWTA